MKHLQQYIQNTEDPQTNFNLGQEYEFIGQTGAAISFYLRTYFSLILPLSLLTLIIPQ